MHLCQCADCDGFIRIGLRVRVCACEHILYVLKRNKRNKRYNRILLFFFFSLSFPIKKEKIRRRDYLFIGIHSVLRLVLRLVFQT